MPSRSVLHTAWVFNLIWGGWGLVSGSNPPRMDAVRGLMGTDLTGLKQGFENDIKQIERVELI